MTSRDFCYWLMGYFEISDTKNMSSDQIKMIKNHLNLVFKHEIDPSIDGNDPFKKQEMQLLHDNSEPTLRC